MQQQPAPAYDGEEPFVFVSYSHQDESLVYREIQWLQDRGVNVWYDSRIRAGSEWSEALANAISRCSRFLYFITPNSVVSESCRRELNHAMEEGRPILSVHLEETEVPGGIRLNLNNRQAILKYRLLPDVYHASLLEALSADEAAARESKAAAEPPSFIQRYQFATVATLLVLVAVGIAWLWQRDPGEPEPSDTTAAVQAPLTAIAVLPFDDLSPAGDQTWLAGGMAEDLIESLGRIEELHVPARRSTAVLKRTDADLATIGERLQVGTVVEGSVRRIGDHLGVVARWIRVSDGAHLWSARFDRQFDDVFAIQKEITVAAAEAIRTELGIQDAPPWAFGQRYLTSDVRAWELVKKAVPLADTGEPAKLTHARDLLLLALEYDPEFVEARARLAWIDYQEDVERGVEGLKDAVRKDPSNVTALRGLAYDSAARHWDYETAERLLDRIPPNQKTSWLLEIEFHVKAYTVRLQEALQAAERAVRLDPMWARAHCQVGFAYHWQGESEPAGLAYERALSVAKETDQAFGAACSWDLAYLYLNLGRESEVLALSDQWVAPTQLEATRRGWEAGGWKGLTLAIAEAIPPGGDFLGRSCNYNALAQAGTSERMYECLEKEFEETGVDLPASDYSQTARRLMVAQIRANHTTHFAGYAAEARFQDLLRRIKQRMNNAAGTYESKVDLSFLR